jgi:hypothetical protein
MNVHQVCIVADSEDASMLLNCAMELSIAMILLMRHRICVEKTGAKGKDSDVIMEDA